MRERCQGLKAGPLLALFRCATLDPSVVTESRVISHVTGPYDAEPVLISRVGGRGNGSNASTIASAPLRKSSTNVSVFAGWIRLNRDRGSKPDSAERRTGVLA